MINSWYKNEINRFVSAHTEIDMPDETKVILLEYFEEMAHFYEVIPLQKVYEILTKKYDENVSEKEFYEFTDALHSDPIGHFYIDSYEETFDQAKTSLPQERFLVHESAVAVNLDIYINIQEIKRNKPYYVPSKEEMLKYSDDLYYEETEQMKNMSRFFIRKLRGDYDKAIDIMDEIMLHVSQESDSIDDALNDIQRMGFDMSIDETKEFIPYYIELRNNSRMPANNGYTPIEIEDMFKGCDTSVDTLFINSIEFDEEHEVKRRENSADMSRKLNAMAELVRLRLDKEGVKFPIIPKQKKIKVGRNDPCPCGSGKKFKKCCGR